MRDKAKVGTDPELAQIDALEAAIVRAHDERAQFAPAQAAELARQRPAVVARAKAVADRLREEYRVRSKQHG